MFLVLKRNTINNKFIISKQKSGIMKKMSFLLFVALFSIAVSGKAQSMGQKYKTAVGVKFWDGGGVTLKHFINDKTALEGILFFWGNGVRVTGLYELHFPISSVSGLQWYVGPGAHIGFYNNKHGNDGVSIGIDGVLGLDYKLNNAPLNFSLDWNPNVEFGSDHGFNGGWGGFAVRYTF